jgi:lipopolysaccharide transport protein LptA
MARSSLLENLRICALTLAVAFGAGAQNARNGEELQFTSSGPFVLDGQTNMMRAQQARIVQGNLRIVADEVLATGLEFEEAGEFRLSGNVRIDVDSAFMEANSAIFMYANGRLSRGELEGTPVSFGDVGGANQRSVTGTAEKMSYDTVARTLRMIGNASVLFPTRQVFGCDLIYDFGAERASSGSADCADGFRVTLRRDSEERAPAPEPPR